ncbi:MAG: cytochrome c biogenesis protein ResB [Sulfuriflexus sp.]|nr:cytochrome c biogenesis protein ResB [Sulfuriflexus sp.]
MNTEVRKTRRYGFGNILVEFLGSMNLAITVLSGIAIASIIGTILRQNEPYQNYIIKFGPFWHDMFVSMGLYDIYGAWWFVSLLFFLLLTTSVCVVRNGPQMIIDMRNFRINASRNSLRAFHNNAQWKIESDRESLIQNITSHMQAEGYNIRSKEHEDHTMIAAMRGGVNRLGYIFTHLAIVVVCVGSVIMYNMPLKYAIFSGDVKIETDNTLPASKVPAKSVLKSDNPSYRGAVSISEGQSANIIFLNIEDGFLIQELPFQIELKDFRIEHYDSGQPKSFESDLVIHDDELDAPLEATISVNHPLIYRGNAIYQASFNDGGSKLSLRAWPLNDPALKTLDIEGAVFGDVAMKVDDTPYTIELSDFRKFNINPIESENNSKKFKNFGPNFTFKVRDEQGQAREYVNYMFPIEQEGRLFMLSGVRSSVADTFRYLYIPADANGSVKRFMQFYAAMQDKKVVSKVVSQTITDMLAGLVSEKRLEISKGMNITTRRLVSLFAKDGLTALNEHIQKNIPVAQRQKATATYFDILRKTLGNLYINILQQEGLDITQGVSKSDSDFFDDALTVIGNINVYGAPFYLEMKDFEHIQASGLQIARAPGKEIIVFGCVMLIIGIFIMFYIQQRRCWVWVANKQESGYEVIFAGSCNRNERDFAQDFKKIKQRLAHRLGLSVDDENH